MRSVAYGVLASGALMVGMSGSAAAGCYGDCDEVAPRYVPRPACTASYEAVPYKRVYKSYDRPYRYGCGHRHVYRAYRPPIIIYGDAQSQMGPVYSSTGHYYYGPYVSHRANFGYGGCRTAVLPYGPVWHVASNC